MDKPISAKLGQRGTRGLVIADPRAHIVGWGADLDHANRPAYPMERSPPRLEVGEPVPPAQQSSDVEVLHSIERPGLTPVFGTTCPPRGVSGAMRRRAFGYSESDLRHWLMLLAADRVDMVEGLVSDLARGHVPNIYREIGGRAAVRHNPVGTASKVLTVAAVIGLGYWLLRRRSR